MLTVNMAEKCGHFQTEKKPKLCKNIQETFKFKTIFFLYNSLWLNIMSKILMVILMVNLLSMPIQCPQRKKCQKKTKKNKWKMAVFH